MLGADGFHACVPYYARVGAHTAPPATDWCSFDVALPHMDWAALLRDIAGRADDASAAVRGPDATLALGRGVEVGCLFLWVRLGSDA